MQIQSPCSSVRRSDEKEKEKEKEKEDDDDDDDDDDEDDDDDGIVAVIKRAAWVWTAQNESDIKRRLNCFCSGSVTASEFSQV